MLTMTKNAATNKYSILSSFLDVDIAGVGVSPSSAVYSLATNIFSEVYCNFLIDPNEILACKDIVKTKFYHIRHQLIYDISVHILKNIEELNDYDEWVYETNNVDNLFDIIKSGRIIAGIYTSKLSYNKRDKDRILAGYELDIPKDGSGSYNKKLKYGYDVVLRDSNGINIEAQADDYQVMHAYIENKIMNTLLDKYADKGISIAE